MILVAAHHVAIFKSEDGRSRTSPVVAWDDHNRAMVLHESKGELRVASGFTGFVGVTSVEAPVGAIPGGGWMVEFPAKYDSPAQSHPLTGWVLTSDGDLNPQLIGEDGIPVDLMDGRIYHLNGWQ